MAAGRRQGKPRLAIRWKKGGRIRWRDLHATTGILLSVVLICYIVSGLTWSRYWGENWRAVASTVTPSASRRRPLRPRSAISTGWAGASPGPTSKIRCTRRRLRVRRQNRWASTTSTRSPDSEDGSGLFDRAAIGLHRGRPDQRCGSYTVVNHWPQETLRTALYLDQFSGKTIANATADQDGALSRITSWGVDVHMGTQYRTADPHPGHRSLPGHRATSILTAT